MMAEARLDVLTKVDEQFNQTKESTLQEMTKSREHHDLITKEIACAVSGEI